MIARSITLLLLTLTLTQTALVAQIGSWPEKGLHPMSAAERSAWSETTRHAAVLEFIEALKLDESEGHMERHSLAMSGEEREIPVIRFGSPKHPAELRVLINANIHAGEVEGKEVALRLLRELAHGEHRRRLEGVELWIVPNFNADGNERISRSNRVNQNGPEQGVGQRPNAAGLDLNRDFIKLESPEARGLVRLMNAVDPHVLLDLHTTNGSDHGYHLTYAPSLSTNVDAALNRFTRERLLPAARRRCADDGFRIFDYGNFGRRGPRAYFTYDHRPRFGTNYCGLRNRIGVVVESYAYYPFRTRAEATYSFVFAMLDEAKRLAPEIRAHCEAADASCRAAGELAFGFETQHIEGDVRPVFVGENNRRELPGVGTRFEASGRFRVERMPARIAFRSDRSRPLPRAWLIEKPRKELIALLIRHGLRLEVLEAPLSERVERFRLDSCKKARRPFQGHRTVSVSGSWERVEETFSSGALVVTASQSLARVAAQLLEPESEDSATTWSVFNEELFADPAPAHFPVRRLPHSALPASTDEKR